MQMQNVKLPIDKIAVIDDINSRQTYDEEAGNKLAESIKKTGLLHPLTVMQAPKGSAVPYLLVSGFRRLRALQKNKATEVDCRVLDDKMDIADALAVNLSENLARENVSAYEISHHCRKLHKDHKMTPDQISNIVRGFSSESRVEARSRMSESHVRNMIRLACDLCPEVQKAWQACHPKASLKNLLSLVTEKDPEAQAHQWKILTGEVDPSAEDKGDESEGDTGEGGEEKPAKPKRASADALKLALDTVKDLPFDDGWKKGASLALKFALGKAKFPKMTGDKE